MVVIMGHGDGMSVAWDATPGSLQTDEDLDRPRAVELRAAFSIPKKDEPASFQFFDIVGFNACLMGMIEVYHKLTHYAGIGIASEGPTPIRSWPYVAILRELERQPSMTPRALAQTVFDECMREQEESGFEERCVKNPDREEAGKKYEEIRRRLIKIFTCRGSVTSEDLADETINRVARKLPEIIAAYVGDPALYFLGVAHNVWLESVRPKPEPEPPPAPDSPEQKELLDECLGQCMQRLTSKSRDLILEYYREERHAKIDHRKELAQRLKIAVNALRIQACRIRATLQECVFECLKQRAIT